MMSLQSIGASRFATPFITIVRQWEKDLTVVSDTLDVSALGFCLKYDSLRELVDRRQLRLQSETLVPNSYDTEMFRTVFK